MNILELLLLSLIVPTALLLSGYWLAHRLSTTATERLAFAVLGGLGLLLWTSTVVNFYKPLNGIWAWLCLWPIMITLLSGPARRGLREDFRKAVLCRSGLLISGAMTLLITGIIWPLCIRADLIYYDATSNHDSFFWISAAEYLKRHSYMEMSAGIQTQPFYHSLPAILGWNPIWGRMGAEGLLALTSSVAGVSAIKLYIVATSTLIVPWCAAVFLTVRTFFTGKLSVPAGAALVALQPIFVFFHNNANLPNLIGALAGGMVVIATARSLGSAENRAAWLALLALGLHGVLSAYPELLPFIILPGGLLWLRSWFLGQPQARWKPALLCAAAWIFGTVMNPVSTVRAWFGFIASFETARENQNWANLFEPLALPEYGTGLATLSIEAAQLGPVPGLLASLVLIAGMVLALRRAHDRVGAIISLSGFAALMIYTLTTGFDYGWQKTVQFGGVFWAALVPVAVIDAYAKAAPATPRARLLLRGGLWACLAIFIHTTAASLRDAHGWSQYKDISQDWFTLRDYTREHLPGSPLLIDGASFEMPFFHSMWATYFLADNHLSFRDRGNEDGGYHNHTIKREPPGGPDPSIPMLVGRKWADSFEANSPRLLTGSKFALLTRSNRISGWTGLYPDNGFPLFAAENIVIELSPHSPSRLELELDARSSEFSTPTSWRIINTINGVPVYDETITGAPPWRFSVPLTAGQSNEVEFKVPGAPEAPEHMPWKIEFIQVSMQD